MATKKDLIPSVINKIRTTFQNSQNSPVGRFASGVGESLGFVPRTFANIGAGGATAIGGIQMAMNRPELAEKSFNTALNLRKYAGTEGSFDQGTGWKTIGRGTVDALQLPLAGKGISKLTPTSLGVSGLIGAGAGKISGQDPYKLAGQSVGALPAIMGFTQFTNPYIAKGLRSPKIAPLVSGSVGSRAIPAIGNVVQGVGMDLARGMPVTAGSVGLDLATGALGGKTQFDAINLGSSKKYLKEFDELGTDINKLRMLSLEDRDIMGKFTEMVERGKGKNNLGELGLNAQIIAEGLGLKKNLTNTQLAKEFDKVIELADVKEIVPQFLTAQAKREGILAKSRVQSKTGGEALIDKKVDLGFDMPKGPELKQRGFSASVQEAPNVSKEVKSQVLGGYEPKPNEQLMGEAKALLVEGGDIRNIGKIPDIDKKVAATMQEAINQQKLGNHEAAANLFNNLSEVGTELGRGVQAFSLLKNMSPGAISLSVAGKIKKYNQTARVKIPELTGEQQKLISEKVMELDLLKGREKNIALNELNNLISKFIPSSLSDKAITVWKAGLLTSFRTQLRNFVGNTISGASEIAKDLPASAADIVMSKTTGKRTIVPTLSGLGEFGSKETRQQVLDIIQKGYDPKEELKKFDYKKINWGGGKVEKALEAYTNTVFRLLEASDKPYYNAAMARSLYSQAAADAINQGQKGNSKFINNLVKKPTEEMIERALADANYATFKNKNKARELAGNIKQSLGKTEFGKIASEVAMPFTGVPSSILGQIVDYSPIGLLKGIYNVGQVSTKNLPDMQRQAAQEIGRGVMGTGVYALGAYLMSQGLITGQPKDAVEARQWELEGKQRNSIMINGKWRSLNSIGPQTVVFLAGAKLQEDLSNEDAGIGSYATSIGKDYLDQSFVQGLQGPVNALTDPQRYGKSYVGNMATSFIPNIVKDTSKATDPYMRETNTIGDYIKQSVPGLRRTLTERRDVLGNVMKQEPGGISAFFDLFNSKTPITNDVVNEIGRLYDAGESATPSKLIATQNIRGEKVKLTPKELNELEAGAGEIVTSKIDSLIKSQAYQQLNDENKADAIKKIVSDTRKQYKNLGTSTGTSMSVGENYGYVDDSGNYKTVNVQKVSSLPEQTAYQRALKQKEAFKLVDDVLDNLSGDEQINALKALGITGEDASYYNTARQENYLKSIYVEEEIMGMIKQGQSKDQILNNLAGMRKGVNEKVLLADGVIKDLVDKNIISYQDGQMLKNIGKDLKTKGIKAKKPKKISLSSKKFTASRKKYNPLKIKTSSTKSRFTPPKYVKPNFTTSTKLL